MGPQLDSCGRQNCCPCCGQPYRLQWGRNLTVAEGGPQRSLGAHPTALQWGRNLAAAEGNGRSGQHYERDYEASMGPQPGSCGRRFCTIVRFQLLRTLQRAAARPVLRQTPSVILKVCHRLPPIGGNRVGADGAMSGAGGEGGGGRRRFGAKQEHGAWAGRGRKAASTCAWRAGAGDEHRLWQACPQRPLGGTWRLLAAARAQAAARLFPPRVPPAAARRSGAAGNASSKKSGMEV